MTMASSGTVHDPSVPAPTPSGDARRLGHGPTPSDPVPGDLDRLPSMIGSTDQLLLELPRSEVPLAYVREGSTVYLVEQGASLWAVRALREGAVRLRWRDERRSASVALVVGADDRERVLERFREKYGRDRVEHWFHPAGRILSAALSRDASPIAVDPSRYFGWLENEFDSIADDYDRHIFGNRVNRFLRQRSLEVLRASFPRPSRLLEIGCGSGTETLEMLEAGHEVVAVDLSARMLEVLRAKAVRRGLGERLTTRHARASAIGALAHEAGWSPFAGGYSTYGALNCEPDLVPVAEAVFSLLAEHASFVAGVYNRWCWTEIVGYALTGRFRRALARFADPIPVGRSRFCVDTFAYSVPAFRRLWEPFFRIDRVEGVVVVLPPSDLARYLEPFERAVTGWERQDASLGRKGPFRYLGDHFLMVLSRREGSGPAGSAPRGSSRGGVG